MGKQSDEEAMKTIEDRAAEYYPPCWGSHSDRDLNAKARERLLQMLREVRDEALKEAADVCMDERTRCFTGDGRSACVILAKRIDALKPTPREREGEE